MVRRETFWHRKQGEECYGYINKRTVWTSWFVSSTPTSSLSTGGQVRLRAAEGWHLGGRADGYHFGLEEEENIQI